MTLVRRESLSGGRRGAAHQRHDAGGVSLNLQQLYLEHQYAVGRDVGRCATLAVAECGGDDELALAADFHADDAVVPSRNDLTGAGRELEVAGVELRAVRQPAGVAYLRLAAGDGHGASA